MELNSFMMLEEWRRNRQVNPYPGHLGKNMLTIDELLELANRFLSQFPKMRSRESFAKQANEIGVAKMCKRFILLLSGLETQVEVPSTYRTGKSPKTIAEKAMLYEFFTLSNMTVHVERNFHLKFISRIVPMLKTKLKDMELEAKISGQKNDEAFQFLSSLGQLLEPDEESGGESLPIGDLITIDEDDNIDVEDAETEKL